MLGVIEEDDVVVVSELEEVLSEDELVDEQEDEGIDPSCSGWGIDVLGEAPSVIVV